jgi:hypothetical protein
MSNVGSYKAIFPLALVGVLAACGGGGDAPDGEGSLTISVTDAPVDGASNVFVEFTGIELKPRDGERFSIDFAQPKRIDLLALQGGERAPLLDDEPVPAGEYNWMRLKVNAEFDSILDSYIVLSDGSGEELRVPSGSQSGLKLVRGFTVAAGGATDFTIDFDLRKSVVDPKGQPGYFLKPVLRLVDNLEVGTVRGTVASSLVNANACTADEVTGAGRAVYVYMGADMTPEDMSSSGTSSAGDQPLTSAAVVLNIDTGEYEYVAAFLPTGPYTLAFTCQASDDDPEANDEIAFMPAGGLTTTVAAGQTTKLNFTAP